MYTARIEDVVWFRYGMSLTTSSQRLGWRTGSTARMSGKWDEVNVSLPVKGLHNPEQLVFSC